MGKSEPDASITAGKRPYFGYGSNLDVAEMRKCCPDAELVGVARLMGWKVYMDSNGYATIAEDSGCTEGALWLVSDADIEALDEYEGLDRGLYEKRVVEVEMNGERRNALVYVSLRLPLTMETFRADYLESIKRAAKALGLSAATQDRYAEVRIVQA